MISGELKLEKKLNGRKKSVDRTLFNIRYAMSPYHSFPFFTVMARITV